ncbi:MAG TPA: hypothetical protein VMB26_01800 [Candidatus Binataceae bacterium]|nr:hypothetical protein [Candidatus Binataceae bacterium]
MDYIKSLEKAGDDFLGSIRAVQESTITAFEGIGNPLAKLIPSGISLPVDMPRPREVAEATFRFWEKVAENQKDFTLKFLDAITPATKTKKAA